jgi:hypothetical protein
MQFHQHVFTYSSTIYKHNIFYFLSCTVLSFMNGSYFGQVVKVEPLDSLDQAHLKLLDRPDLGITFTKVLRCILILENVVHIQNVPLQNAPVSKRPITKRPTHQRFHSSRRPTLKTAHH